MTTPLVAAGVDQALRKVIEHLDYDLHKAIEQDEDTGTDTYGEHVERFIGAYNHSLTGDPKSSPPLACCTNCEAETFACTACGAQVDPYAADR